MSLGGGPGVGGPKFGSPGVGGPKFNSDDVPGEVSIILVLVDGSGSGLADPVEGSLEASKALAAPAFVPAL